MPMFGEPVLAPTSDPAYLATLFRGPFGPGNKVFTMPMSGEQVPALTSNPAYLSILFPEPFDSMIQVIQWGTGSCTYQ